ncbi:hypothetical protein A3709_19325 [Halioglobus sp. HI00S01]|uniref:phosphoadenosine phosphosulfate reductase domain-containing protein n=1 Tax=Halioglobus sp. HI00S01 TaxID=1822214 RepID=UPI0007C2BDEC|nr:phosphoadenosine phosphosulfate reductase family protein [Halioglobus sp. HI00S01]KZX57776.1 hypothetical protein A3709_19325 [Halioglobus sp. HI00S01]
MTVQAHTNIEDKAEKVIDRIKGLILKGHPLAVACSFGKDSSVVLVLALEAVKRLKAEGQHIPTVYVTHSNTGIETPSMDYYTQVQIETLREYIEQQELPVEVVEVEPLLSSTFMYTVIGKGKLPRFVNSGSRDCSVDWKVLPQQRALKRIVAETEGQYKEELVSLVGTRFDESADRARRMAERGDAADSLTRDGQGVLSCACIADWAMTDVWALLMACDSKRSAGGLFETFVDSFDWTLQLYKDANEGVCAIITGDGGNKAACGARFGCAFCTPAGASDKSLSAMIESDPQYEYLRPVNAFRDYLIATQWDMSKRNWVGRRVSKAGYAQIGPDGYSPAFRRELLSYLITMDLDEQDRAEEHTAKLIAGEIERTPANERLCDPQFEYVTPVMLAAIDFAWSLENAFQDAFVAYGLYADIKRGRRHYPSADYVAAERPQPLPAKRFYKVDAFTNGIDTDGLRDPWLEVAAKGFRDDGITYMSVNAPDLDRRRNVVPFIEAQAMEVDATEALLFLDWYLDPEIQVATAQHSARAGACFMLERGVIRVGRGKMYEMDYAARRGQYWEQMVYDRNCMNRIELAQQLINGGETISEAEHKALLQIADKPEEGPNMDLFGGINEPIIIATDAA